MTVKTLAGIQERYHPPGNPAHLEPFNGGTPLDDEFDDRSFTGWTAVADSSPVVTVIEANDVCSISHPGGDSAGELHAWMKAYTASANDFIEIAIRDIGKEQNFNIGGVIMADGATYNAGVQVLYYFSSQENNVSLARQTGYNTNTNLAAYTAVGNSRDSYGDMFLRLVYLGSNNWSGYISADGVSWLQTHTSTAYTMTPTHVGFFVTTWGGANAHLFSVRYFRQGNTATWVPRG